MRTTKDVQAEVDNDINLISLEKLAGVKIKEIQGHVVNEFGDPTFKLFRICFENGDSCFVEGEHEFPYLTEIKSINDEELEKMCEEEE